MSTEQPVTAIGETDQTNLQRNNQTATDNSSAEMTSPSSDRPSLSAAATRGGEEPSARSDEPA